MSPSDYEHGWVMDGAWTSDGTITIARLQGVILRFNPYFHNKLYEIVFKMQVSFIYDPLTFTSPQQKKIIPDFLKIQTSWKNMFSPCYMHNILMNCSSTNSSIIGHIWYNIMLTLFTSNYSNSIVEVKVFFNNRQL